MAILSGALGAVLAVGGLQFIEEQPAPPAAAEPANAAATAEVPSLEPNAVQIPAQVAGSPVDPAAVAATVIPSVVAVQVGSRNGQSIAVSGSGSGVVLDSEGHIATNDHVVAVGDAHQVILADGRVYPAELVGTDPLTDLAVLRINADDLTPITLGATAELRVGDLAVAVGSPLGLEGGPSLTLGVVSAFGRQVRTAPDSVLFGMIQTDAPITQGSSGGALVDSTGRLIGITTAVGVSEIGVEGIGFASPVELVDRVTKELIERGTVTHAFLGITGETEFGDIAGGGRTPTGVQVLSVESGSAAESAGIEVGDVITMVDDEPITAMDELVALLRGYRVGQETSVEIERDGLQQEVRIALGARTV